MNAMLLTDGYKLSHHKMYPKGTEYVYSNFTPRSNKFAPKGAEKVLHVGTGYALKFIHQYFQDNFFSRDENEIISELERELSMYVGSDYDISHMRELHRLGYLPIKVKALYEGVEVPMRVPVLTIVNTLPQFFWVTNYLETILSNLLWLPMTSASTALLYKRILKKWAIQTDKENVGFVDFQAHDFSMRGMGGLDATVLSGIGHASVFLGSDNLPVISAIRKIYEEDGFIVAGVPASEHSVMCAGSKESEIETFKTLLSQFPTGILSIVSDTWDLWKVCTEYLTDLKEQILARDGKLVIRPDSGDPVDIICGLNPAFGYYGSEHIPQNKGVIELLWDAFGGTTNEQGYKVLDPHIGCIYGDSITPERAEEICQRLADKGFASTNVVLGVGSFTYQYKTRDTFGFAMKATNVVINGVSQEIFKDPITDSGVKKSAKGLMKVDLVDGQYTLSDCQQTDEGGELMVVYEDGVFYNRSTFKAIRERVNLVV
jgi:nicotinamide phosphoribosyltransferase